MPIPISKVVVHPGICMTRLLLVSEMINQLSLRTYLVCLDDVKSFLTFTSFNECPLHISYRKIPKISPGAYNFKGSFSGACIRRKICASKSIGPALQLEVNLPFLLCFTLYLTAIFQVQAPGGAYIWRSDLREGFLRYRFGGLIFGEAYT